MDNPTHDLYDFFKNASDEIEKEYIRISKRVTEDPGTAGDQGEENWKELIKSWLPPYFNVVTKGRIIGVDGKTSPQVDVIVLSPNYPSKLLNCKEYLAGGVVAAFECKVTLRRQHIEEFMEHSKAVKALGINENGTPRKDLQSKIYYGLLAHSHSWKEENSKPKENIKKAVYEFDEKLIEHPRQMPDMICVSDIGVWKTYKMVLPPIPSDVLFPGDCVISTYMTSEESGGFYSPVGMLIFDLLNHIAWQYPSVRDIVSYMRKLNLAGSGLGSKRVWDKNIVLSDQTKSNLIKLVNGGFWNEWDMTIS